MALVLCAAVFVPGCFKAKQAPSQERGQRDLAKQAVPLADQTKPPGKGAASSTSTSPGSSTGAGSPGGSTNSTSLVVRQVGTVDDASGDMGDDGKSYGDAVSLVIEEIGPKARITLTMTGDIPNPLPSQEVMGIGVDFFSRTDERDSSYQLFADGSDEGWFGYLQAPSGLVEFKGTLAIGGNRLVFEIPWSELGGIKGSQFSCFVDWSGPPGLIDALGKASEDHAPDSGRASLSR